MATSPDSNLHVIQVDDDDFRPDTPSLFIAPIGLAYLSRLSLYNHELAGECKDFTFSIVTNTCQVSIYTIYLQRS